MKAAIVSEFGQPLTLEDRQAGEPDSGQVLVRTEASGLCHTDLHAAAGDWPVKPSPPFIPGHEVIGTVERAGADVTRVSEGDRVAIPWLGWACGECEYCTSGRENLCESQVNTGYGVDGGWAQYALGNASYIGVVPEGIDPFDAAPLTCAGVTTHKAVKMSGAQPSDLVAVFGVGGLGHLAVQYARIAGAQVVAVDLTDDKLRMAKELGASYVVNAREQDPAEEIQQLGGADACIGLAGSPKAFEQAYHSLRRGGTLVLVGLPAENELRIPIFETVLSGISIVGSIVGTRVDLKEVFELHAAGRTRVQHETRSLDDVNEAMRELEEGEVTARLVFDPAR
ncbi:zinc-dependent alcohol dehydrogenase [Haloechinothrix sp. LS1_15]|uniref:zinc-dependent alcohol dehydrogenase n=1 Tax=Haloechinothrix sp. LS1_15 TaxID=2652248 RepID=UPI002946808C|nr:zinc-dependent alcohol dehydrogenase [Haloechinothrix sp. LS1_15]MDV6011318.1 zinc-dependent alcohol dehydrogenase [Haloechinothrix sp. LS1_15]